ncbi:hypothetical protein BX659_12616 [Orenia metallireducens]|uniref:Uncharacterized protein n=1 Tax=Orenia metallireducens TaxID=1413210 RepID=A0A285I286_9FIRM|nr:hypothetical protein [Orenia metallireducens]PRX23237.1 hypothetical protein BX659_12616 [Orenia metallireducens]SNY41987.1 hypothetical protein SAMN06265827_12916 [Orenia metallireducens]
MNYDKVARKLNYQLESEGIRLTLKKGEEKIEIARKELLKEFKEKVLQKEIDKILGLSLELRNEQMFWRKFYKISSLHHKQGNIFTVTSRREFKIMQYISGLSAIFKECGIPFDYYLG